jgi:hypothetical protein
MQLNSHFTLIPQITATKFAVINHWQGNPHVLKLHHSEGDGLLCCPICPVSSDILCLLTLRFEHKSGATAATTVILHARKEFWVLISFVICTHLHKKGDTFLCQRLINKAQLAQRYPSMSLTQWMSKRQQQHHVRKIEPTALQMQDVDAAQLNSRTLQGACSRSAVQGACSLMNSTMPHIKTTTTPQQPHLDTGCHRLIYGRPFSITSTTLCLRLPDSRLLGTAHSSIIL